MSELQQINAVRNATLCVGPIMNLFPLTFIVDTPVSH
ncbi:hypothetical protein FHW96_001103 [Novosphingobium sp. SG751A]|nr:hypothetical protein [Novosphingobium sp. SG751A]